MSDVEQEPFDGGDDELPPLDEDATARVAWEWHLNRIRHYQQKVRQVEADRDAMIDSYVEWALATSRPWVIKCEQSEAWLEQAMLDALEADPRAPKTVNLPSGTVRSTAGRDRVEIVDEDALATWAYQEGRDDVLVTKVEFRKAPIMEALKDGEIVPGVELRTGERTVKVVVEP